MTSSSPPARSASSSSDRADLLRAIVRTPWCAPWQEHTELHAMALALLLSKPRTCLKVHHYPGRLPLGGTVAPEPHVRATPSQGLDIGTLWAGVLIHVGTQRRRPESSHPHASTQSRVRSLINAGMVLLSWRCGRDHRRDLGRAMPGHQAALAMLMPGQLAGAEPAEPTVSRRQVPPSASVGRSRLDGGMVVGRHHATSGAWRVRPEAW
jgi:hypothetical protein